MQYITTICFSPVTGKVQPAIVHHRVYSTECHLCALLETKGPRLVAKGQFQGPEIPIGLLLSLIG